MEKPEIITLEYAYYPAGDVDPKTRNLRESLIYEEDMSFEGAGQWRVAGGTRILSFAEMQRIRESVEDGPAEIYRIVEGSRERISAAGELPVPPMKLLRGHK